MTRPVVAPVGTTAVMNVSLRTLKVVAATEYGDVASTPIEVPEANEHEDPGQ